MFLNRRALQRAITRIRWFIAAMAALYPLASATAQPITFVKIAGGSETAGVGGLSAPAINGFGTVAFVDSTPGNVGLFTGTGGPLTTLDTSQAYNSSYTPDLLAAGSVPLSPSINDAGRVAAITGSSLNTESIITTAGGPLTTIASGNNPPVGGSSLLSFGRPSIANDGTTAFTVGHSGGLEGTGLFTGTGGPLTTIYSNSTAPGLFSTPSLARGGS